MLFAVIIIFIFISFAAFIEIKGGKKMKGKKEAAVSVVIILISFTVFVLFSLQIEIPSPLQIIGRLFKDVLKLSYQSMRRI